MITIFSITRRKRKVSIGRWPRYLRNPDPVPVLVPLVANTVPMSLLSLVPILLANRLRVLLLSNLLLQVATDRET